MYEVFGSMGPVGKLKRKSCVEQAGRRDAAAFEHKLGLGAHEECADFQERRWEREAIGRSPGFAQFRHEHTIRLGIWRSDVDWAVQIFAGNDELHRARKIIFVNPGNELAAIS